MVSRVDFAVLASVLSRDEVILFPNRVRIGNQVMILEIAGCLTSRTIDGKRWIPTDVFRQPRDKLLAIISPNFGVPVFGNEYVIEFAKALIKTNHSGNNHIVFCKCLYLA